MISGLKNSFRSIVYAPQRLARATGSNFYYAFILLPPAKKEALKNIYGFCRIIDDIVDETHRDRDPFAELDRWREELESCYSGYPETPFGERLMGTIIDFDLPKQPFHDLIDGMEMDLKWHSYQTFADLREYCYRAASAVGLICIEIFGYESLRTREYAVNLGLALQLTNILRDLREDASRGRIYLPLEDLDKFGYTQEHLRIGLYNTAFIELMKYEQARTRSYFDRATGSLSDQDRPSMFAAEIMGTIYREILDGLEDIRYDVFHHRILIPKSRRLQIALRIWAKSIMPKKQDIL